MTIQIDEALVKHVAKLSQLKLSDEEVTYYQENLKKILGYVDELRHLPKEDESIVVEKAWQVHTERLFERPDERIETISTDEAIREAKDKVGTAFKVARIL
jgi:aspartyl/glutamyl-tRNA(Asn/Gln) amidotransferase C subunit